MMPGALKNLLQRKLVKDILRTTAWSAVGKTAGFLVPFLIAFLFGVSKQMDAFFLAYGIILFLANIFAVAITTVIIPYIAEARAQEQNPGAFIGSILLYSTLILAALCLLLNLSLAPLARLVTPFTTGQIKLLTCVCLEMIPLVFLLVYAAILDGALNAYKKFTLPALSPALRAAANILLILLLKERLGVHAIVIGYTAGELLRLLLLLVMATAQKLFTISIRFTLSARFKSFLQKAFFQLTGMVLVSFNLFIDKTMAAWLGEGSVSVLYYGERLYMILLTLAVSGLAVTLLSHWSEQYYASSTAAFAERVSKAARFTLLLSLPPVILLLLLSRPLLSRLFSLGLFENNLSEEISLVFSGYLVGFIPYLLAQIYARAHIVLKHTRIFLSNGIIMFLCNILLNLVLMTWLKTPGLALATSLVNLVCCIFLLITFQKKHNTINRQNSQRSADAR